MISLDRAVELAVDCYLGTKVTDEPETIAYLCGFREALRAVFSESEPKVFNINIDRLKQSVNNWDEAASMMKPEILKLLTTQRDLSTKAIYEM